MSEYVPCPKCGSARVYQVKRTNRRKCAEPHCRHDFTITEGTARASNKKSADWYDKIDDMLAQGLSPYRIAMALGLRRRPRR